MEPWAASVAQPPDEVAPPPTLRQRLKVPAAEVRAAAVALAVLTVVGVGEGLLWSVVSPRVGIVITSAGPDVRPNGADGFFAGEVTFALLGIALGIVLALVVWYAAGRWRGPVLLLALVLGALAGAVLAWQVGSHLGLSHYREMLRSSDVGREFTKPVELRAKGMLLLQPMAAALTYVMLAAWRVQPDLRPQPPAG